MARVVKFLLPVIVLACAVVIAGYLVKTRPKLEPSLPAETVWTVDTVVARIGDLQPELSLYGEVVAGREVELRALVAGEVVETGPQLVEGGIVRKGDTLIVIDDFDYRAAVDEQRALYREAKARLEEFQARQATTTRALAQDREMVALLERDLERAERLSRRGNVSEKLLDQSRMELTKQRQSTAMRESESRADAARIEQQKALVARAEVGLRRARRELEQTRLTAPFDGYLTDVQAELGKRLNVNDRVARLIDAGRLEVKATMSDSQFGRLAAGPESLTGRAGRVVWQVGDTRYGFDATVVRIGSRIETASGGVDVYARIAATDPEQPLRPGAFVRLQVRDRLYTGVARLPEAVLHGGDRVYVIEEGRSAARRVDVVARLGGDILVGGDLADGERVIVTRYSELGPGQRVKAAGP